MIMERLIKLSKEYKNLYNETGLIGFTHDGQIQLDTQYFFKQFDNFSIHDRTCSDYAHEAVAYKDEVRFFTIMSEDELKTFTNKTKGEN